jgi:membrane fusion protein (multidrug efflux system)
MRVLEGALVGQGEATLLTTVEQVDPIFVFFDQPASDFERLQRAQATGMVQIAQGNAAEVHVIRADGSEYPHIGTLDFSDYSVNASTGAVAFRARVPNPDHMLLPGMYTTVRVIAGTLKSGFEVPQLAVQRDSQGSFVLVAGQDGTVVAKRVEVVSTVGANWIISSGLADGDQVVVSGIQNARPGMKVKPVPADAKPGAAAPAGAPGAAPAAGADKSTAAETDTSSAAGTADAPAAPSSGS